MSKGLLGHRRRGHRAVAKTTGERDPRIKTVRKGIRRAPRDRTAAALPLSDAQREVLEVLDAETRSVSWLTAEIGGRTPPSVTASLYALADRGLAERVPYKGWRRA